MAIFSFDMRRLPSALVVSKISRSDQIARRKNRNNCLDRTENSFLSKLFSPIRFFSLSFVIILVHTLCTLVVRSQPLAIDLIPICPFVCAQSFELLHLIYVFETNWWGERGSSSSSITVSSLLFIYQNGAPPTTSFASLLPFSIFLVLRRAHTHTLQSQHKK